jgi:hypothetical protein
MPGLARAFAFLDGAKGVDGRFKPGENAGLFALNNVSIATC